MRGARRRRGGRVRIGVLLFLLVVSAVIYLADKLIPPYWAYLSLMDPVKEAALLAAGRAESEARARTQLLTAAKAQGLELTDDDIVFARDASGLTLRVSWVAPVEFPRYRYDLHFSIEQTARVP